MFIDRDKFSVDGSTHEKVDEGSKELAKLAPDIPLPQCYEQDDSASAILELSLSANSIGQLAESIKSGTPEVNREIADFLTLREKCGYVSTDLKVDLRYSEEISDEKYQEIFNAYLGLRNKLKTISPRVNFEITIENV